jgi:hypothetical protein
MPWFVLTVVKLTGAEKGKQEGKEEVGWRKKKNSKDKEEF